MMVYRWVLSRREATEPMQTNTRSPGSSAAKASRSLEPPRHLAWLLVGDPNTLDEQERGTLGLLRQQPEVNRAFDIAQRLSMMVKERKADPLETWLLLCCESGGVEVANFARGLQKEFSALQAALTLEYSNDHIA